MLIFLFAGGVVVGSRGPVGARAAPAAALSFVPVPVASVPVAVSVASVLDMVAPVVSRVSVTVVPVIVTPSALIVVSIVVPFLVRSALVPVRVPLVVGAVSVGVSSLVSVGVSSLVSVGVSGLVSVGVSSSVSVALSEGAAASAVSVRRAATPAGAAAVPAVPALTVALALRAALAIFVAFRTTRLLPFILWLVIVRRGGRLRLGERGLRRQRRCGGGGGDGRGLRGGDGGRLGIGPRRRRVIHELVRVLHHVRHHHGAGREAVLDRSEVRLRRHLLVPGNEVLVRKRLRGNPLRRGRQHRLRGSVGAIELGLLQKEEVLRSDHLGDRALLRVLMRSEVRVLDLLQSDRGEGAERVGRRGDHGGGRGDRQSCEPRRDGQSLVDDLHYFRLGLLLDWFRFQLRLRLVGHLRLHRFRHFVEVPAFMHLCDDLLDVCVGGAEHLLGLALGDGA